MMCENPVSTGDIPRKENQLYRNTQTVYVFWSTKYELRQNYNPMRRGILLLINQTLVT
jgi:hypothetical protein